MRILCAYSNYVFWSCQDLPPRVESSRGEIPRGDSTPLISGSGRTKQSKETERAFSRSSFLLFDSEWFFNRSRRSSYLFLLLVLITCMGVRFHRKMS